MKTTLNVKNFIRRLFWFICIVISAQFAVEMCVAAQNRQNLLKLLFWRSRSLKVIDFGANRKPVYDFLLVINSVSHRFWDTAIAHWLKITNFLYPILLSFLAEGDLFQILG